ncbi:MAG: dihydrodipicolinate synthase family protein [Solirubrobacterales bacterium]|nr:dihydrodipicolinate synthase family protein [Solirubrobacterales bacterium]
MIFTGVVSAVTTPFEADGTLALARLREHVEWLIESGCAGVTACGTMGEASALTRDERAAVIAACVEAAAGRVPVIAGISATGAAAAAAYARDAAAAGADALMCLPPLLYAGDDREVRAFLAEVAAATELPLQLYNNPHASGGTDLPAAAIAELMEIDGLVSVKECSGDARRIAELLQRDVDVMVGGDDWALEGAAAGASGWVSGVVNVAPVECVALWAHARSGELAPARELYARVAALARMDMTPKLVQYFKAGMDAIGRYGGPCRPPRLDLTGDERREVADAIAALVPAPV